MGKKVLVGCEESQEVTIRLRRLGIEAYSCDTQSCSGNHPEWHFKLDIFKVIDGGNLELENGEIVYIDKWNMGIFFPPCTHLAVSGAAHFEQKRKDGRQQEGIYFFIALTKTNIPKWCIENPVGIMSKIYRKPDQIIQPYYFGDEAQKTTCLWLHNLPLLYHNDKPNLFDDHVTHVGKGEMFLCVRKNGKEEYRSKHNQGLPPSADRGKIRSKTFPGIAEAFASQWSKVL